MPIGRPAGREKNVTGNGTGVHRRGEGTGLGRVGSGNGPQTGGAGKDSGVRPGKVPGTGGMRASGSGGGRSPLVLIIIAAIILLGGGGGIGSLLGGLGSSSSSSGTGSSSSGTGQSGSSYTGTDSYSGYTGHSGYGDYTGSSSAADYYSQNSNPGLGIGGISYSSSDFSNDYSSSSIPSLSDLFGGGFASSAAGISTGWADGNGGNTGVLNTNVADGTRSRFTKIRGNGRDTITFMVYLCGTDLESRSGMATSDLTEMASADLSDNINLLVYTGGCSNWKNSVVSSRTNQIYRVRKGGLERLVEDDGNRAMTDPATLTRYIKWCAKNYPADRYELIFWDHGGGSVSGYGYDQKHSGSGSMDLAEIHNAIADSKVKFDMVGFDACLMATAENAISLSSLADYMIASEETEPGIGWYYTNWLNKLSQNTSMPTTELGKLIIDDYIYTCGQKCHGQSTTLSLIDLAELANTLPGPFSAFAQKTSSLIEDNSFRKVSTARSGSREFASSTRIDQVDLVNLAQNLGTQEGQDLMLALLSAIKYNRTSSDMTNSYGLSIYFPKSKLSQVSNMVETYRAIGMDEDYTKCIQQVATIQASGQAVTGGSSTASPYSMLDSLGSLFGSAGSGSGYSSSSAQSTGSYGSFNSSSLMMEMIGSLLSGKSSGLSSLTGSNSGFLSGSGLSERQIVENLSQSTFDSSALVWNTRDGQHTLYLSDDQWGQVTRLEQRMFVDDGEGYIDLGEDNLFEFNASGDLVGDTDGTWLSINGQPVAYYHTSTTQTSEGYTITGRVPCLLNGERADLIIVFDTEYPYGYISGARPSYADGETETQAKAVTVLQKGDTLDFLCDYYKYDGTFEDSYFLGDQMVIDSAPVISNTHVGDKGVIVSYCFTDIYGQQYWTPPIVQ